MRRFLCAGVGLALIVFSGGPARAQAPQTYTAVAEGLPSNWRAEVLAKGNLCAAEMADI
jgi:hypothetical protein